MKKILFAIILSLLSVPAFATQYYIDYSAGNDSNNGLTTGTAFKTCTPIEGTNFLLPGDILSIADNSVFTGTDAHCLISSKGTSVNPITINDYGSGTYPTWDGSVDESTVPGWTGWGLYIKSYAFTITSSTISANAVYTSPNGASFIIQNSITSSTLVRGKGTVNPDASGTLTKVSGSGPATVTYSAFSTLTTLYKSNATVPFVVTTAIIDGSYSLRRMGGSGQNQDTMLTEPNSQYQSGSGAFVYVELSDNSDPSGHTIAFGRFGPSSRGLFRTDDTTSAYLNISNIIAQGAFNMGITSGAPHVNFTNATGQFNGREGIYFYTNATTNGGQGASYDTCTNCLAQYNNNYFTGSAGQGVTVESPHVDFINLTTQFNWMAGFDLLKYPSTPQNNPIDDRCINCIEHNNSMRAWGQDPGGFDPVCVYSDGASNVQLINNVCYADGIMAGSPTTAIPNNINSVSGIVFGTEGPNIYSPDHFDLINSLVYGVNFFDVGTNVINCSGAACRVLNNMRIIGCTISGGAFEQVGISQIKNGGQAFFYNNILNKNAGSSFGGSPGFSAGVAQAFTVYMDYNTYYNPGISGSKIWDDTFGHAAYDLAAWQALSGQDAHSQFINPILTGSGTINNINQSFHLSSIAAGQGSDSPVLGFATPNYLGSQYVFSSIGSVRTDDVVDNSAAPAGGYHYNAVFQSSTFPSVQIGSDYF